MVYPVNVENIIQAITIAGLVGVGGWVFALQGKIATFVTRADLADMQKGIGDNFSKLHDELKKVSEDLAYLRGKSGN